MSEQALKTEQEREYEAQVMLDKSARLAIANVLDLVRKASPSRERSLCATKLQEAGMWLGMDLRRLADGVSCYRDGNDMSNARVDPPDPGAPI